LVIITQFYHDIILHALGNEWIERLRTDRPTATLHHTKMADEDWDADFTDSPSLHNSGGTGQIPKLVVNNAGNKPTLKFNRESNAPKKSLEAEVLKNNEIESWLQTIESESSQQRRLSKLFKRLAKQAHEQASLIQELEQQSAKTRSQISATDNQIHGLTQEFSALHSPTTKDFALELRSLPFVFSNPLFDRMLVVCLMIFSALCGALIVTLCIPYVI